MDIVQSGLNLYIVDRLLRQNHTEKKEIEGMKLSINTISAVNDILSFMSIHIITETM